jgi:DNA-directed RNA polymerase II subunit RPB1
VAVQALEYLTIEDLTIKSEILYDPDPKNTRVEADDELLAQWYELEEDMGGQDRSDSSPWVIRIELDNDKFSGMRDLTMEELVRAIQQIFNESFDIVRSEDNMPTKVLRLRFIPDMPQDEVEIEFLKGVEEHIRTKLRIRGYDHINKVFADSEDSKTWTAKDGFVDRKETVFLTDGTNMMEVLACPDVDFARTTCNDVVEIFMTLGIEAARAAMLAEIRNVLFFDGGYINYRHMSILVDVMTFQGSLTAVSRHGINRGEQGPLLRASFEETLEVLSAAAVFGEYDDLNGVTENIMLGQVAKVGTGIVELLLDEEALKNAVNTGDDMGYDNDEDDMEMDHEGGPATPTHEGGHTPYGPTIVGGGASPGAYMTPFASDLLGTPSRTPRSPFVSPMVAGGRTPE